MCMQTLYYFKDHDLGGDFSLADRAGIPLDQRTGDQKRAVNWPGPLIIFDGWDQPEKFSMLRARGTLPTRLIYDYSYEAGVGVEFVKDYLAQAQTQDVDLAQIGWILNTASQDYIRDYPHCCIDYFALDAVWRWREGQIKVNSQLLTNRPSTYNCLVGKLATRPIRMECLWEIWRQGLADRTRLGLLVEARELEHYRSKMVPWNQPEFWHWLDSRLGATDNVQTWRIGGTITSKGYPYDPSIYSESRVTIICETTGQDLKFDSRFITEKTYRPIMNLSPWVLIAGAASIDHLESLGFRTFRHRFTDPDYSQWSSRTPTHVHRAVRAAQELMAQTHAKPREIQRDLEMNQQTLISRAQSERSLLRAFLDLEPDPGWACDLRS